MKWLKNFERLLEIQVNNYKDLVFIFICLSCSDELIICILEECSMAKCYGYGTKTGENGRKRAPSSQDSELKLAFLMMVLQIIFLIFQNMLMMCQYDYLNTYPKFILDKARIKVKLTGIKCSSFAYAIVMLILA